MLKHVCKGAAVMVAILSMSEPDAIFDCILLPFIAIRSRLSRFVGASSVLLNGMEQAEAAVDGERSGENNA